jgi:hypothetical protein
MTEMDYKRNLINYLKRNLSKGYTSEALKWALIRQGYPRAIVEHAIEQANKEMSADVPVFKEKPKIKYEIIDENNKPIKVKKPFWKRIFGR